MRVATYNEFRITGVKYYDEGGTPLIVLQEVGDNRAFVIAVSKAAARSVCAAIDPDYRREYVGVPLEHDTALSLAEVGGVSIKRVIIDELTESRVFGATLEVQAANGTDPVCLEVRPSDAVALAVRCNAPIYVAETIMPVMKFRSIDEFPFRDVEPEDFFGA
jgi:bifunctional DNase/RNase